MMNEIGPIDYYKCSQCGFTQSRTHSNLDIKIWERLNYEYHHYIEKNYSLVNQPPYLDQASMINILAKNNIINTGSMLDYAGGYGTLGKVLKKYYGFDVFHIYDPFVKNLQNGIDYVSEEQLGKYQTVFNSALFEHILDRHTFDKINSLVLDHGCMIIHTVVCENIPKDPNWFYLAPPVHCSFHTNKSMSILMEQWDYKTSIYCPTSKCWILFKTKSKDHAQLVQMINEELQTKYLYFKVGFVDYWKGF